MKAKFKFTKFSYDNKLISPKLNNGDWDYWFVIQTLDWREHLSEREFKEQGSTYNVCINVVSPQAAGKENVEKAFSSTGFSDEQLKQVENDPLMQVEALNDYGIHATIWQGNGNNLKKLLKEAKKEAQQAEFLFGFYMDRPQNALGSTGWDFISGNILAGLSKEPNTPQKEIIKKMSGA